MGTTARRQRRTNAELLVIGVGLLLFWPFLGIWRIWRSGLAAPPRWMAIGAVALVGLVYYVAALTGGTRNPESPVSSRPPAAASLSTPGHAARTIAPAASNPAPSPSAAAPASPTPTPAQPAAAPPPPPALAVTITTSVYGSLAATTVPGATCTAQAQLPSGRISTAKGLQGSPTAGSDGGVSWSYRTQSNTEPGTGTHTVTCKLNGQTATAQAPFTVGT